MFTLKGFVSLNFLFMQSAMPRTHKRFAFISSRASHYRLRRCRIHLQVNLRCLRHLRIRHCSLLTWNFQGCIAVHLSRFRSALLQLFLPKTFVFCAEKEGVEPSRRFSRPTPFPGEPLRPAWVLLHGRNQPERMGFEPMCP